MISRNAKQSLFREFVLGTVVYSVVIGAFNDYTDILATDSYSITFSLAVVMQVLTFLTLEMKKKVVAAVRQRVDSPQKLAVGFAIWLIMFSSKFVFLAVIDRVFGTAVEFSGFFGIFFVIIAMTVAVWIIEWTFDTLGD